MENIHNEGKPIVEEFEDDYKITKKDRQKNGPLRYGPGEDDFISLDRNNILIVGQSQSGKTLLLNNLLIKYYLHEIKSENIYIFSKTASFDLTYRPVLSYMVDNSDKSLHISESINMDLIS